MGFNSQVGQDEWVCSMLNNKKNGYFLEIGAYDGIHFSNTYHLETELGWDGVCVEAGARAFKKLLENRKCLCLHRAIGGDNKTVNFIEEGEIGGVSSYGDQEVEMITMEWLLSVVDAPKYIDYISLDVEGYEYEALLKFPFEEYGVGLWTIEHNSYLDEGILRDRIRFIMTDNGYKIYRKDIECGGLAFEDWYINKNYETTR